MRRRFEGIKHLVWWLPELALLAVVLHYSLAWGIAIAVAEIVGAIFVACNHLRKIMRCFQTVNESRIFAILSRLEISDEDVKNASRMGQLSEKQLKELDQDFVDVGL